MGVVLCTRIGTTMTSMGGAARHRLVTGFLAGLGAVAGLVMAVVVVLNLHIFAGVVDGYMASSAQVVEHSVLLAVVRLRSQRTHPR